MAKKLLIIMIGESNAASYVPNSQIPTGNQSSELGVRDAVSIVNNSSLIMETLNIGVNNKLDEYNALPVSSHGWELGLANIADANGISNYSEFTLVKAAHGGVKIRQFWANATGTDGTPATNFWTKFVNRYNVAKNAITATGDTPEVYVLFSQGINDALAWLGGYGDVSPALWKTEVQDFISRIRGVVGYNCPVLMTKFDSFYESYVNVGIDGIVAETPNTVAISNAGLTKYDDYHWDYASSKTLAGRFITAVNVYINAGYIVPPSIYPVGLTQNQGGSYDVAVGDQVTLNYTGSLPAGGSINWYEKNVSTGALSPRGTTSTLTVTVATGFAYVARFKDASNNYSDYSNQVSFNTLGYSQTPTVVTHSNVLDEAGYALFSGSGVVGAEIIAYDNASSQVVTSTTVGSNGSWSLNIPRAGSFKFTQKELSKFESAPSQVYVVTLPTCDVFGRPFSIVSVATTANSLTYTYDASSCTRASWRIEQNGVTLQTGTSVHTSSSHTVTINALPSGTYDFVLIGDTCLGVATKSFTVVSSVPVCDIGGQPMSISAASWANNVLSYTYSATGLTQATWKIKQGSVVVQSGTVTHSSSSATINTGALATGGYVFELSGVSCAGTATKNFNVVNALPVCDIGGSPMSITAITVNGTTLSYTYSASNLTEATWRIKQGSTILQTGTVTHTASSKTIAIAALQAGTYVFELIGSSCVGSATTNFTVISSTPSTTESVAYFVSEQCSILNENMEFGCKDVLGTQYWLAPISSTPVVVSIAGITYSKYTVLVPTTNNIDPTSLSFRDKTDHSVESNIVPNITA